MLKQISIFAANAKGALGRMTDELAKGRINIYTMLATDSAEFGIVRIIVDDANNAKALLTKAGYQCRIDFVIAVDMASYAPGTLNKILDSLNQANVNIRYLYISFDRKTSNPIVVMQTDEAETETFLMGKGYKLVDRF